MEVSGSMQVGYIYFERNSARWSAVEHFCMKFNSMLKCDESSFESVHEELLDYKTMRTMRTEELQP